MNGAARTIAKNATILMGSQLVTWTIALAAAVVLPRYLGPESIGAITIAGAVWAIPSVFIAFGTDTLLVKEIARAPERAGELCGTALVLRALLYVLSWVFVAAYILISQMPVNLLALVVIIGVAQIIMIGASVGQTALQGLELMGYSSIAEIASKAVGLVLIIGVLLLGYGIIAVALAGVAAAVVYFVIQQYLLGRQMRVRIHFDLHAALAMAQAGRPYLLSALALTAYSKIDSLIISALIDQRSVGYYAMAQQLVGTLVFIPTIFITAIFPALSRSYTNDPAMLPKLARKSFDMLLLLAVPIGLGTIAIADPLVVLLFGQNFAPSGPILAVQGVTLIFLFLTILLGRLLISTDRQNVWTIVMIVATLLTIPLDFVLVPWCQHAFNNGAIGGVLSFVITELGMVITGICLLPKGTLGLANISTAARIIAAGAVMLVVTWQFRNAFIAVPVLVGAIVYSVLILLLRVVSNEDRALLTDLVLKVVGRIRRRVVVTAQ